MYLNSVLKIPDFVFPDFKKSKNKQFYLEVTAFFL